MRIVDGGDPSSHANLDASGLVQRIMFLVGFLWYGLETVGPRRQPRQYRDIVY